MQTTTLPGTTFAERDAGLARAMSGLRAGQPALALIMLLISVEAQARAEGITARLPYRREAVAR